jgi:hypothetical protein
MTWWPWQTKQVPTKTAGDTGARCEQCGNYPLIFLNGRRLLCWDHYVEEMAAQRASLA